MKVIMNGEQTIFIGHGLLSRRSTGGLEESDQKSQPIECNRYLSVLLKEKVMVFHLKSVK
jgi:hypothetical protein